RRRHTRWPRDWSSDVCSSDLKTNQPIHGDQLFYNAEANRLARGDGFLEPFDPQALSRGVIREGKDPAADHPPLTVIVLAPVSFEIGRASCRERGGVAEGGVEG